MYIVAVCRWPTGDEIIEKVSYKNVHYALTYGLQGDPVQAAHGR